MFQTSKMKKHLFFSCVGALLAVAGVAHAQEFPTHPDFEVGINGGGVFFQPKNTQPFAPSYRPSFTIGANLTENFANYFGTEQTFFYSQNSLVFHDTVAGALQTVKLTNRLLQLQEDLLVYTAPKKSNFRPFFAAGFGIESYRPDSDAIAFATNPANSYLQIAGLKADTRVMFNYGGGFKVRLSDHFGLRADLRGLLSLEPHYGLAQFSNIPALSLQQGGVLAGLQATGGAYYIFGRHDEPFVPPPPAPGFTGVSIQSGQTAICAGQSVNFTSTVENVAANHTPAYRWTVDGQNAGANAPAFSYTPSSAGAHAVMLTVVDNLSSLTKQSSPVTVTVTDHTGPTITANADHTDLKLGEKAMLYPHPLAGSCPGNLSVSWIVSEGSVTGSDPATYDSSSVSFPTNSGSTKQIVATATVTDDKGGNASAPVNLNVTQPVIPSIRQDDLIFPTGNTRVNNCGKRLLIDVVYPALTSGQYSNYDVVLVGHEGNEPLPAVKGRKGKKAAEKMAVNLALERAQNAAAILSSGDGICPKPGIDLSRIKIATVGPNQGAEFRKPICAASILERKASTITSADDLLKDQRVEIWFVPKGANLPASATNAQQAPDSIRSLSCPK